MHSTPVSIARPKLANSSPITSASPTSTTLHAGRQVAASTGSCCTAAVDVAQRQARQLDLEVDVARAVVAVDHRRPAGRAPASPPGPASPGRARRAPPGARARARSWRAASSQLDHDRHLALRQVELGQRDCRSRRRWRCAASRRWRCWSRPGRRRARSRAAPRSRAGSGWRWRRSGPGRGWCAGPSPPRSAAVCSACGSSPVSTRMYFSPEPPRPTLLRTPGSGSSAARISFSMPCLRGRSPRVGEQDRQRGLARLGRAEVGERVAAGAAAADGGVDALHVLDLHHRQARLLGRRRASAASVEPGGSSR